MEESDYRFSFEHYRVPVVTVPDIPTKLPYAGCKQGTQWGINRYAVRFDDNYRAEFLLTPILRAAHGCDYRPGYQPHSHGGKTVCKVWRSVQLQNGKPGWERAASAVAWCSINDVFNYSVGRAIARGRAWKKLNRLGEVSRRPFKVTNKDLTGYNRMATIYAGYTKMVAVLGEPLKNGEPGFCDDSYKVDVNWVIESLDEKNYVAIWNYKNGPAYTGHGTLDDIGDFSVYYTSEELFDSVKDAVHSA